MSTKNKVKYNLSNVHYSDISEGTNGKLTFATPVPIPGAVSLSLDPKGEPEVFYADGVEYYTVNNNQGYDGSLEIALLPESFRTDILRESLDSNSVLVENCNSELGHFALLFEFDGDANKIRHVMYNCSASRPGIASQTNTEKKDVKTETLNIKARRLPTGVVKAKTGDATKATAYNSWYTKVYEPTEGTTSGS